MFLGPRSVICNPGDMEKGKAWYSKLLGIKPYFEDPYYIGFIVNGYELGLEAGGPRPGNNTGPVAYWGVKNIEEAHKHMLELGATEHRAIQDVGEGIRLAIMVDPFGNLVGIIENPHFKVQESA